MMEDQSLDFISNLPLEIQQQIFSFITLKEAVRTSILSTAWKSLWTPFEVDLGSDSNQTTNHEACEKLTQAMAMFLRSWNGPERWKFSLSIHDREDDDLIFSAIKGAEKEVHLDFSGRKQLTSNFSLILEPSGPISLNQPIDTSRFSSLGTLHLRSVNHLAKNLVSDFFSNCLLLESLKVEKCNGLQSINIKANHCLQSFIIEDCPDMESVTLSAYNLKSFWYRGVLPQIHLKNTAHLVDVILDLRGGLGLNEFDCEDVVDLLASIKDIESLTISGWLLEWLCAAGVIYGKLEFKFNKLKELCWIGSSMDGAKRNSLACFLNISPFLEKLIVNVDKSCISIPCPFFHQFWHEPHLCMDCETNYKASQLKQLKIVKLAGFTSEDDQFLLIDFLLKKAAYLGSMIVTSPENQSWRIFKIPQSQLKQTVRCYSKQVGISSANNDCFFGLTEVDNNN
ncbi:F-box protein At5g03100-like [Cornus florida]|uniref:F-box protein At5g03100-like n=1 Tax=Cornus florida TaxID=4283 RepID=UPI002896B167|nr:F-box protein At5g03100-like [Cornus florida]XP_059667782.1 F-box protein At5g03100-like [Cornus florida]